MTDLYDTIVRNMIPEAARTIRDDANVVIQLDHENERIVSRWKGYVPSGAYREILLQVLALVEEHRLRFWLSDTQQMGPILHDDEMWTVNEYVPLLMKAGLRRIAVIASADFFNLTAVERMVDATAPIVPYKVEFFNDAMAANEWLAVEQKVLA